MYLPEKDNFLQNRFTVIRQNDFASRFMYVPEKEQLFAKSFYGYTGSYINGIRCNEVNIL